MYAKIFAQIYDGTLCTNGPWEALVTFQQLLILADQHGVVDLTASAISRRTTIPLAIIEKGIAALLRPDPESRTPTEDGKRIVPLSIDRAWGWCIVNYGHYRKLKREEDRREYHRIYWRENRSPSAAQSIPKTQQELNSAQQPQPNQPIAEAEAEANAEAVNTYVPQAAPDRTPDCPHQEIIALYRKHLPNLPQPRKSLWDKSENASALKGRWVWVMTELKEDGSRIAATASDGLNWFDRFFAHVAHSDFLNGRSGTWSADLGWLVKAKNFTKVVQGNYDNKNAEATT